MFDLAKVDPKHPIPSFFCENSQRVEVVGYFRGRASKFDSAQ